MTSAVSSNPSRVLTTLNYYTPIGDATPYIYTYDPPEGVPRSNVGNAPKPVEIFDIRGKQHSVFLDTMGFQFVKHVSQEKEFLDEDKVKSEYYKEVEELLKQVTVAKKVFIFDHTIRRALVDSLELDKSGNAQRGPGERVHVDQTYEAGIDRVHYHFADDAERLLQSRPLGCLDWRAISVKDLVPMRLIFPHREGGPFLVRYNPQHKWCFLAHQTPDEIALIKCFDTDTTKARFTAHSVFADANSPPGAPQRQSIEVRVLVFDGE